MGDVEWQAQADQYARIAARYVSAHRDVLCTRTYDDYWNECLFRLLPNSAGTAAFLDPMCGAGNLLERAAARFRVVVGADVSRHMLGHVPPELRRRVTLLCSDVTRLPFPDQTFDAVMIRGGFHHVVSRLAEAMREVSRVLRDGGWLVCTEACDDNGLVRIARRVLYRVSPMFDPAEERGLRSRELQSLLVRSGFSRPALHRFGYLGYVLIDNTDVLPLFRRLRSRRLIRWLIRVDRVSPRIALWKHFNLALLVCAQKAGTR